MNYPLREQLSELLPQEIPYLIWNLELAFNWIPAFAGIANIFNIHHDKILVFNIELKKGEYLKHFIMIKTLKKSIKLYEERNKKVRELKASFEKVRVGAKEAIALLRRDNFKESKKKIDEIESILKSLKKEIDKHSFILEIGFYKEAIEEYAEAKFFYSFLTNSKYEFPAYVVIDPEQEIGGLCDFTGELVRKCISIASSENLEKIIEYKNIIEDIINELTKVGLSKGTRNKYDQVERNMKKVEDIIYDINLIKMREFNKN